MEEHIKQFFPLRGTLKYEDESERKRHLLASGDYFSVATARLNFPLIFRGIFGIVAGITKCLSYLLYEFLRDLLDVLPNFRAQRKPDWEALAYVQNRKTLILETNFIPLLHHNL
jgi:hypothetical protein